MHTQSTSVVSRRSPPATVFASITRRPLYVSAGLATAGLAVIGFWPTYFGPLVAGRVDASPVIHVHAVVYVLWLGLFIAQAAFAARGRIALHRRVGRWMMAYGVLVIVAGLMAAFEGFSAHLAAGDVFRAQRWLFGVLRQLGFFAPFLIAGWIYRGRPDVHKRLMIVATTILIVPAIGRMTFLGTPPPLWTYMLVWPLPMYAAMVHDFHTKRLVHPVYVIGLLAMLTMRLILSFGSSQTWQSLAAWITAVYQGPTN